MGTFPKSSQPKSSQGWFSIGLRGWLAAGLAIFVVGIVLLARLFGDDSAASNSNHANKSADENGDGISRQEGPLPYDGDAATGDKAQPSTSAASAEAIRVAAAFVKEWVRHPRGESADQWRTRVSRYATTDLGQQLRATDPARVPAQRLTAEAIGLAPNPTSAIVTVPTDAGNVVVTCILTNVWQVSGFYLAAEESRR